MALGSVEVDGINAYHRCFRCINVRGVTLMSATDLPGGSFFDDPSDDIQLPHGPIRFVSMSAWEAMKADYLKAVAERDEAIAERDTVREELARAKRYGESTYGVECLLRKQRDALRTEAIALTAERDSLRAEVERLRGVLIGYDPDDPRWTWLPGAVERLRKLAPADEDADAMYECANTLDAMYAAIREALRKQGTRCCCPPLIIEGDCSETLMPNYGGVCDAGTDDCATLHNVYLAETSCSRCGTTGGRPWCPVSPDGRVRRCTNYAGRFGPTIAEKEAA